MNKIILIGRVTRDIELKITTGGTEVAEFSLAVTRKFKNINGEYDVDFINCTAYKHLAKTISAYVKKGDKLCVEGRIQVNSYINKEGKSSRATDIIVENIDFLESRKKEVEIVEKEGLDPFETFGDAVEVEGDLDNELPF